MEHALLVRVLHGLGHALHEARRFPGRERMFTHAVGEIFARHVVHGKPEHPVLLANVVDGHDTRMLHARGGRGLGAKARLRLGARKLSAAQHLHRHLPREPPLPRAIDDAHAAARDLAAQFVIAEHEPRLLGIVIGRILLDRLKAHTPQAPRTVPGRRPGRQRDVARRARGDDG